MKRIRKPDDPEKRKKWASRKDLEADLEDAKDFKKRAGTTHHIGHCDRGRKTKLAEEAAANPVYRALLINSWVPEIREGLERLAKECLKPADER